MFLKIFFSIYSFKYPCKTNHFIIFSSSKTPMQSLSFAQKKQPKMLKKPSLVMKKEPRRKYYSTALVKLKELKTFWQYLKHVLKEWRQIQWKSKIQKLKPVSFFGHQAQLDYPKEFVIVIGVPYISWDMPKLLTHLMHLQLQQHAFFMLVGFWLELWL